MLVKAGICVAYDWKFLEYSLPPLYALADRICLSIDVNQLTWNGNEFALDKTKFNALIRKIDVDNKIFLLEESFYNSERPPILNECYQRKRMADELGPSDWMLQIDCDEIIMDPNAFKSKLKIYRKVKRKINIAGLWVNIIKQTDRGFVYSILKTPPLATNYPEYNYGRTNGHFNIYTNAFLGHITWARDEAEVKHKLENWGHSHEFNGKSFYKIWQALDDDNWRYIRDFHPMYKKPIPFLFWEPSNNLNEFLQNVDTTIHRLKLSDRLANNIWVSRFKSILNSKIHML